MIRQSLRCSLFVGFVITLPRALDAQAPASTWTGSMNMDIPKEAKFDYGIQRIYEGVPGEFIVDQITGPGNHRLVRFDRRDGHSLSNMEWESGSKENEFKQVEMLMPLGGKIYAVESQRLKDAETIPVSLRLFDPTSFSLGAAVPVGSINARTDGAESQLVNVVHSPDGMKALLQFGNIYERKGDEMSWIWLAVVNATGSVDWSANVTVPRNLKNTRHTAIVNNAGEVFVRVQHFNKLPAASDEMSASVFKVGRDGSRTADVPLEGPVGTTMQTAELLGFQGEDLLIGGTTFDGKGDGLERNGAVLWRVDVATGKVKDMDGHDLVKENGGDRVKYLNTTRCHPLPDGRVYLIAQSELQYPEPINGAVFVLLLNPDGTASWVRRIDRLAGGVPPLARAGKITPLLIGDRLMILSNDSPDNITRRAAGEKAKNITVLGGEMIPIGMDIGPDGNVSTVIFDDLRQQGHMFVTDSAPFTQLRGTNDLWMMGFEKMAKLQIYPLHLQWE